MIGFKRYLERYREAPLPYYLSDGAPFGAETPAVPLYFLATFFLLLIRFTNTIQVLLRFLLRALPAINLSIFQNGKSTYE
jgi:hypothetical protein